MDKTLPRSFLFVAHPGHELRVHHWIELYKPTTWVLTDGSGPNRQSRTSVTKKILTDAGSSIGEIMGDWTDSYTYEVILQNKFSHIKTLFNKLCTFLIKEEIELVAGDAIEGYNPSHDLVRYILNAAVVYVKHQTGRNLLNYDFSLIKQPNYCHPDQINTALKVDLDDFALQRKLIAAKNYEELTYEVNKAIVENGEQSFATEYLIPAFEKRGIEAMDIEPPYYETYGAKQVASGHYKEVIRYREHMQPLVKKLFLETDVVLL